MNPLRLYPKVSGLRGFINSAKIRENLPASGWCGKNKSNVLNKFIGHRLPVI